MNEDDFKLDGGYYKFMPPGTYKAKCVNFRGPTFYRGTRNKKLYLDFVILDEPYADEQLFMALNIPPDGIRPGGKYFRSWVIANDGNLPSRNATMSPKIFVGKTFTVKVRTSIPVSGDREMGTNAWYSVIDSFVPETPDMKEAIGL
jgi:hypothetical protein